MDQLENKRQQLRAILAELTDKKATLESAVDKVKQNIEAVMQLELKEADDLRAIAAEFQNVSLQQTVDQVMALKDSLAVSVQPVMALAAANNEFAATVLQTIEQSGPMIEQIKTLFADLSAQIDAVQGTLEQIGLGQLLPSSSS